MLLPHPRRVGFVLLCFCWVTFAANAQDNAPVHPVDGQFIKEWLVLGPFFENDLETDFLDSVGGEANIDPKEGNTVITEDNRTLVWKRYATKRPGVDLNDAIGNHTNAPAYAFCHLHSDIDQQVEMRFGSRDGASVWLNGKRVSHQPGNRHPRLDGDRFVVNTLGQIVVWSRCLK